MGHRLETILLVRIDEVCRQLVDHPGAHRVAMQHERDQVNELPLEAVGPNVVEEDGGFIRDEDIEERRLCRQVALEFDLARRAGEGILLHHTK